jgi:hypothetical protein
MTLSQDRAFELLRSQEWRMKNLYKIKDKEGEIVDFEPNWAQNALLHSHNLNIVLKARQLGITTYHALLFLDTCLFQPNTNAAIVADSKPIAREIFIDKVKFAYDNLPQFVRDMCHAYRDNVHEMRFANGSVFRVATSLRGGTLQYLHITEFAKICQDNPTKANEIISGALNAVQAGQFVCIESTARGREGHFYNLCKGAQELQDLGTPLGTLDWKLWFFPWWQHPDYVLDSTNVLISKEMEEYFEGLESKDIILSPEQKAWYVKKMQTQGEYMKREYPSTPEESFEAANEGFYFAKMMSLARQERRICHVPYDEAAKTYTSWDIGIGDMNAIWVFQIVGREVHFIDYYENSDEPLTHYVNWLKKKPYIFEKHFMPHDAASRSLQTGKSLVDIARGMGLKIDVLPRDSNEMFGIECLRNMLNRFFFDQTKCEKGIKAVESFRKEWNEKLGCYREKSYHDWASHGSKALIYAAEAVQKTSSGAGMTAEEWNRLRREWL